jgi:hypothetical protein
MIPTALRNVLAAGLLALPIVFGLAGPSAADPRSVPFVPAVGDTQSFAVRYLRTSSMNGAAEPVIAVDYDLEFKVTAADENGFKATILNHRVNVAVDRQRVLTPPDFDSLLLLAIDGMTADVEIGTNGALVRVTNWDALRGELTAKAKQLAGDNQAMMGTIDAFLPRVGEADAVQIFARPLAMSAPGRIVSFDPPERTSVDTGKLELPSFATYAAGRWSFDLVQGPDIPDSVTVEWLGVPGTDELKAILAPIGAELGKTSQLTDETRAAIAQDGRMWQRFSATYDTKDGVLLAFQGAMELQAGPLRRRVALEAAARGH